MKGRSNRKIKTGIALFSFAMLGAFAITGCYYDKEQLLYPNGTTDCNTHPATFTDVNIIIRGKCATAGCHNAATAAGNAILETYDQIKAKATLINQRVIIEKTMPPGTPLSASEIAALQCWLNLNMPNN